MKTQLVEIDGLSEITAVLKSYPPAAKKQWRKDMRMPLNRIRDTARRNTKSRSGASRRSMRSFIRRNDVGIRGGGKRAPQVRVNEFGLRHPVYARPIFGPLSPKQRSEIKKTRRGRRLGDKVFEDRFSKFDRASWEWVQAEERPVMRDAVDGAVPQIKRTAVTALEKVARAKDLD